MSCSLRLMSFDQGDKDLLLISQSRSLIQVVILVHYTAVSQAGTLPISPSQAENRGVIIQGLLANQLLDGLLLLRTEVCELNALLVTSLHSFFFDVDPADCVSDAGVV